MCAVYLVEKRSLQATDCMAVTVEATSESERRSGIAAGIIDVGSQAIVAARRHGVQVLQAGNILINNLRSGK